TPVELSALVLGSLRDDVARHFGQKVQSAVITVPAYFRDPARRATLEAARGAGLEPLAVLNEPVAAALAFGMQPGAASAGHVFVYDLGGGTFDVSLLRFSERRIDVIGHDGDHLLGGKDWDEAIVQAIGRRHAEQHGVNPADDLAASNQLYAVAEE